MKNFVIAFTMAATATLISASLPAAAELYGGPERGEAVIYAHPDFYGDAIVIRGAEPNLKEIGLNDRVSSIEVSGSWEICTDPNFRGRCTIINGSVTRLSDLRMNDNITSLRPAGRGQARQARYDRDRQGRDRGNYRTHNDGIEGRASVFFPKPRDAYGKRLSTQRGQAGQFCRAMGYGRVLYANTQRRHLTDVLCAK